MIFLPVGYENNWFKTIIFNSRTVEVRKLPRSWEHIPMERWLSAAHSYSTYSCSPNILCWPQLQRRFEDMGLWESLVWIDMTNLISLWFNSCWIHWETNMLEVGEAVALSCQCPLMNTGTTYKWQLVAFSGGLSPLQERFQCTRWKHSEG